MITRSLFLLASLCSTVPVANASVVLTFENQNSTIGAGLDNQTSGSFLIDGITISVNSASGPFNATASGFGINQAASGDDTDAFDFTEMAGPGIAENFTISFDQAVILNNFSVSSFGSSDQIEILAGPALLATINTTGTSSLGNFVLPALTNLSINTTAGSYGNGWSFDSIEVTAVPEPSSFVLFAAGTCASLAYRKRRKGGVVSFS